MALDLHQDLRDRVVAATHMGMSCRAAASGFGVGAAAAVRSRHMSREHGV
jgi:transposase